jgi:ribosomal protein L11 methyltransferase
MDWLEVRVVTDGEGAEAVAEVLRPFAHGGSVVMEQLGDDNSPDPEALDPAVTVKIYVAAADDTPALRHRLREILYHLGRLYPLPPPEFREIVDEDWANTWKANYHPFRIGERIWIRPSWIESSPAIGQTDRVRPEDVVLALDPGMAFGTGAHPTTQLCLLALEQWLKPGIRLLDIGTGSAILAIAAAKLGAVSGLGIDIDEMAVKAALANVAQNNVQDQVTIRQGELVSVVEKNWDIVVVNILASVIITLLEEGGLLDYLNASGILILSGILDEQQAEVQVAISQAGGQVSETLAMGDWVAFVVRHAQFIA